MGISLDWQIIISFEGMGVPRLLLEGPGVWAVSAS